MSFIAGDNRGNEKFLLPLDCGSLAVGCGWANNQFCESRSVSREEREEALKGGTLNGREHTDGF